MAAFPFVACLALMSNVANAGIMGIGHSFDLAAWRTPAVF
jgi:hypothetical protein